MKYRVTKAVTHQGHYYKAGDVVDDSSVVTSLARLFGWVEAKPKQQASASPKKGARKPAAKPKK